MGKWKEAVITRMQDRSPTVRSFWVALTDRERLDYRPGQFLTLDLPISERRRERWRSYSIASAPDGSNEAELCIVHLPGGRGTDYLFKEVEVGSQVLTREPGGVFTLPDGPLPYDVVMVCTGTGVAPFRAMLQERLGREERSFHLIYGCRTTADLLYREEFEELARRHPNFTYTATLSREQPEEGSGFLKGYVHQVYERDYPSPNGERVFYLCGWAGMVDEAKERLLALGYGAERIREEIYG